MCKDYEIVIGENNFRFLLLGTVVPEKDNNHDGYCSFFMNAPKSECVYIFVLNDKIEYLGQTKNLKRQLNSGYGKITESNLCDNGQSTNCRINKAIFAAALKHEYYQIFYHETDKSKRIKEEILTVITTKYNKR